ncbi:MAG: hypothetical protein Kow00121_57980 [Elainellaceae cyanobacterium]
MNALELYSLLGMLAQKVADLEAENRSLRQRHSAELERDDLEERDSLEQVDLEQQAQQQAQQRIAELQAQLAEQEQREQELQFLYALTQEIGEAAGFDAALEATLRQICEFANWSFGEVWVPSADQSHLQLSPAYYCNDDRLQAFRLASSALTFTPNQGLPGRVWQSQCPEWHQDMSQARQCFLRADTARNLGIKAAFGVPILAEEGVVAILVFFTTELQESYAPLLQLVASIAVQLRQLMRRKQAEASLRQSEATNRAIVQAIPDLLVRMDREGNYTHLISQGIVKAIRSSEGKQSNSIFDLIPQELAEQKMHYIRQALATGEVQVYEQQIEIEGELRDEEICVTVLNEAEVLVTVRDVTERQVALRDRQRIENSLRESEERFRRTFEQAAVGIGHVSPSGEFLRLNQRFADITGYPLAELQALTFQDITHPEDLATDLEQVQKLLAGEIQTYALEKRYIHKDGTIVWVNLTVSLVRDRVGEPSYFISVIEDITSRKQTENTLRDSEERLRLALTAANQGLYDLNLQTGEATVSPEYATMLGYDPVSFHETNDRWKARLHPDDREQVAKVYQDYVAGKIPEYKVEFRQRTANGDWKWVLSLGKIVEWDAAGKPLRMLGTHTDIDDRIQIRQALQRLNQDLEARVEQRTLALRESEERWQLALRGSNASIWDRNFRTNTIFRSHRWKSLRGFAEDEVGSEVEEWSNNIHPEDYDRVMAALTDHLDRKTEFYQQEYRVRCKDGSYIWLLDRGQALWNEDGDLVRMVGSETDISAHKQTEEELRQINEQLARTNLELAQATRLKDEFLANMSHELRTPLNAILGMSEGLQEGVFDAINNRQAKAIATIERSGRHLLELINDILDLSKIESGKLELQISTLSVYSLCDASIAFVKQMALKKNIQINTCIPADLGSIQADDRRLRQVLINLLSNAVKFTPEGGTVTLDVWRQSAAELPRSENQSSHIFAECPEQAKCLEQICFAITDTGIGIAAEDLNKLFQPFVQIDSSLSRQYAGTGLGLALVERITQLHGGTIAVTSCVGQGSCFTVCLPSHPHQVYSHPQESKAPLFSQSGGQMRVDQDARVLIIEDSAAAAEQIARYLHEMGMKTIIYPRGEGAIQEVQHIQPALVILDIQLPSLSGWDVLTQLKANHHTQEIPVLIISVIDERAQAVALGASGYLVKPINRIELRTTLEKLSSSILSKAVTQPEAGAALDAGLPLLLLAEDNEANIETISGYLESRGYRLTLAKNGHEAVAFTKAQSPDLILMDIQMPEMDGLEAIRQIRCDRRFARIPIIALTALAMSGDREKCLAAGADEYLTKPIKLKQLVAVVQQLLEKSQ